MGVHGTIRHTVRHRIHHPVLRFRHSASSWVAYTRKPPCRTNCWNILDVFGLSAGGFLHSLEELDAN